MSDDDRDSRSTPVEGFKARVSKMIPPAVRTSLPPDATRELIAIRLAEECRRYDDVVADINEERRAALEAFIAVVAKARRAAVPFWVKVAAVLAILAFGIAIADIAFHLCVAYGRCR